MFQVERTYLVQYQGCYDVVTGEETAGIYCLYADNSKAYYTWWGPLTEEEYTLLSSLLGELDALEEAILPLQQQVDEVERELRAACQQIGESG